MNNFVLFLLLILFLSCRQERFIQGKRLYDFHCSSCHLSSGEGLGAIYPSLISSDYLGHNLSNLPCLIRTGKESSILSNIAMPANLTLTDSEMSNLINYMLTTFRDEDPLSPNQVESMIDNCPVEK